MILKPKDRLEWLQMRQTQGIGGSDVKEIGLLIGQII